MIIIKKLRVNVLKNAILINDLRNGGAEKVVSKIVNNSPNILLLIQIWPEQFNKVSCGKTYFLLQKKGFILFDLLKAAFALHTLIKQENITSINSHLFWANYLNIVVSLLTKHRTISTHCVSFVSKFRNQKIVGFLHRTISTALFKKCAMHIYKSYDMKKEYEELFNLKNGKVIYNPIHIGDVIELAEQNVDFKFNAEKKYLLCVGRFHPTKKQSNIIKSLCDLPVEYEVIFLGDGQKRAECELLALDLNLVNRVHFLGQCSNPYPFYKHANIYVSASESEGFPNALVEAIVLKCYPIHFDCPTGPREILSLSYSSPPIETYEDFELYGLGVLLKGNKAINIANAIRYHSLTDVFISTVERDKFIELVKSERIFNLYESNFKN